MTKLSNKQIVSELKKQIIELGEKPDPKGILVVFDTGNPSHNITAQIKSLYTDENLFFPVGLQIGLGVFLAPADGTCKNACLWAIKAGYRHIDTAAVYRNEEEVGEAIVESGLDRSELFITTKLFHIFTLITFR